MTGWTDEARRAALEARRAQHKQHPNTHEVMQSKPGTQTQQPEHPVVAYARQHGLVERPPWTAESIVHFNMHEAHGGHEMVGGQPLNVSRQGGFNGPVFAVHGGGRYFTTERFHSFASARARAARVK